MGKQVISWGAPSRYAQEDAEDAARMVPQVPHADARKAAKAACDSLRRSVSAAKDSLGYQIDKAAREQRSSMAMLVALSAMNLAATLFLLAATAGARW